MRLLVTLCLVVLAAHSLGALQCKDEDGNDVDWYVVYKFPRKTLYAKGVNDGSGYMFITNNTVDKGWTVSTLNMKENANIMAKTFANMYNDDKEELWLVYNDQSPREIAFQSWTTFGHTKGLLGANAEGGFWLVHSIPHFPELSSYEYPSNAYQNGQSALCISMTAAELDKVGKAFQYNAPDFEKKQLSDSLSSQYTNLAAAAKGETIQRAPWYLKYNLISRGGVQLQGFAKTRNFGKDLYEWVAADLDTDLYAETWQNEPGPLPASCSIARKVMNIKEITVKTAGIDFSSHKDHSKVGISASSEKPFVCIGDINRATPQEKRGGGTVCLSNQKLWKSYSELIADKETCN